jgi:sulfide:quinone oxidoreductase
MKRIVILGAGTAGTMMANKLAHALPQASWAITVIDRDDKHVYQPGLLFLPFDRYDEKDLVRSRRPLVPAGVDLRLQAVDRVDPERKIVRFQDGSDLAFDVLIVATGTRICPEDTEGLTGPGWGSSAFDFYTLEGARDLRHALATWDGGRLVLNVVDMPIKCPVAPLEFLFLADDFFTQRGIRDRVELVYATPLDGAFTKPRASAALGDLLAQRNIRVEPEFNTGSVDTEAKVLQAYDGRNLDYDLLVSIPLHAGSPVIADSGMGDDSGFVPTDKHTLRSRDWPDVFVIGDATDLPSSKAGSVAHFQAEVLVQNVLRHIEDRELLPDFDGHANCFVETGFGKAILIDFNYETEPLPGNFPLPGLGPFRLLGESHTNHWGKLGFRWVYWNLLLKGRELPIDHRMVMAGKWS